MKNIFIACTALSLFAAHVSAETIVTGENFDIVFSEPVDLGDNLFSTTLTAQGKGAAVLASFDGTIGGDGGLHQEQFPGRGGNIDPTPTSTDTDSAVDSNFRLAVQLALTPLSETVADRPSEALGRDSFGPGDTNFGGVLSGNVTLVSPIAVTPIAQLVYAADGEFSYDFSLLTQSALGGTERFTGVFPNAIPEPTTALLAGLALVGFVARRK